MKYVANEKLQIFSKNDIQTDFKDINQLRKELKKLGKNK